MKRNPMNYAPPRPSFATVDPETGAPGPVIRAILWMRRAPCWHGRERRNGNGGVPPLLSARP